MNRIIKDRLEKIEQGIVPAGYQMTKLGILPEDWQVQRLEKVSERVNVGFVGTCERYYVNKDEGIPMIRTGNIQDKEINLSGLKYVSKEFHQKNKKSHVNKNDLLLARHGSNGQTAIYKNDYTSNCLNIIIITPNNKKVIPLYLHYQMNSQNVNRLIMKKVGGSTQKVVNLADIKPLKVPLPSLPEQEEIAHILSTWDKAIENIEKLIQEKETQKKGLMQELLTGKTRLAGFTGDWEEVKLGDLGKTFNGLSGKNKDDFGQGYKFITYMNVFKNYNIDLDVYDLVKINDGEKQNKVKYGDVFFTVSSETAEEVGMSSVLLDEINEDIYLNSFCFGFRLNDFMTLLPEYASFYFRGKVFRSRIYQLAQGSTRFNLSKVEVLKIKLKLPPLPEQEAIAQILSTADQEIDLLKELLQEKKEEKKGLMQLLLTGVVRVREV